MSENTTILVPIDFSELSLCALDQAAYIAKNYNHKLVLLHVIEDTPMFSKLFSKKQRDNYSDEIKEQLEKIAIDLESKKKIASKTIVSIGKVYEEIIKTADSIKASMLVMGKSGDHNSKKRFIGSNSMRVIREAKIPVITVGTKQIKKQITEIVLPLDLSKETKEKVATAISLSKLFNNSIIRVVSVLFTNDEFMVNRLTRQLGQVKAHIERMNVECSAEIVKGTKGEESLADNIIEYSIKVDGDFIMIMTQQEVESTKYFIGSSAQEIVNNSKIPVLSIRPSNKSEGLSLSNL